MALEQSRQSLEHPKSLEDYSKWLLTKGCNIENQKLLYGQVCAQFREQIEKSIFWTELIRLLPNYSSEYFVKTSLDLFQDSDPPRLVTKSPDSFVDKCFRYTFIKADKLPDLVPAERIGAPHPCDFIGKIDDVVRTLIVVKFLDGVEYIARKLTSLAAAHSFTSTIEYKCSEQGYFAAHFYIKIPFRYFDGNSEPKSVEMPFEIQISTQLQEVLRKFLHFQYEHSRLNATQSGLPWQWRYKDDDFFSNALGPAIRNIEGQIMDARRRRKISDANG